MKFFFLLLVTGLLVGGPAFADEDPLVKVNPSVINSIDFSSKLRDHRTNTPLPMSDDARGEYNRIIRTAIFVNIAYRQCLAAAINDHEKEKCEEIMKQKIDVDWTKMGRPSTP